MPKVLNVQVSDTRMMLQRTNAGIIKYLEIRYFIIIYGAMAIKK